MHEIRSLLAQPHLSVLARDADYELQRVREVIEYKALVDGRADLEELFGELLAFEPAGAPKTLDLIGHSTPGDSLLTLGDWVIDAEKPAVTAFFAGLADADVLQRLGISAVRLIGCETAGTPAGRATIVALADLLALEVYGTCSLIYSAHYNARGFKPEWSAVLVSASDLRRETSASAPPLLDPYPRTLDLDALPAAPLAAVDQAWPRRIATTDAAAGILRLVNRSAGAQMPGLLAAPRCELALPAARPGYYHIAQVVLDGEFIRVYPDGAGCPGIVYPVSDAHALRALADTLPVVPAARAPALSR